MKRRMLGSCVVFLAALVAGCGDGTSTTNTSGGGGGMVKRAREPEVVSLRPSGIKAVIISGGMLDGR